MAHGKFQKKRSPRLAPTLFILILIALILFFTIRILEDPAQPPVVRWRSAAQLFYNNWLNYYVYQTTPYDLDKI